MLPASLRRMKSVFSFCVLIIALPLSVLAQTSSFFSISAIDLFPSGEIVSSDAISFNKSADCVQINTGLSIYIGVKGVKEFEINCIGNPANNLIELKLFPNPTQLQSTIKSSALLSNSPLLELTVIDALGRTVMVSTITSVSLYAGASLNFSAFPNGNYFLRIHSDSFQRVIPFIKLTK
jgi:hypothetical protein